MEIGKWIDEKLTPPHGNHKGLSYGELSVLLLTYIITQSDHRLSAVEPWIEANRKILELTTGWSIGKKDATDDRLARVVEELGLQSEARLEIEVKLGRHLIRAYELPTEVARTDTTSFSVNHQQDESAQESLLRYGYSKDLRPDLLQYRQLLATLDPMGMPLVSATLEGNGADDPLYLPTWQKLVKVIGHKKFVFIADCKAGSMATRAQIAANAGIYCFPVPMSGQHPQYLKQWVLSPPAETLSIRLPRQDEEEPAVGKGFEVELGKFWFNQETNKWVRWHERYLVVYSLYFQNEDRITGLMFILNIALRVFTLMEFVVRKALQQTQQSLAGLYDGNPKRKTSRPSAERMLKAFCHLTLYYLPDSTFFITPLSELQKQILALMKMPESLYQLDSLHCKT